MRNPNTHSRLVRACYSFMLPIARLLLRSGVGFKEFAEVSRIAFVQVATTDYGLRGRPTNLSRVAAMTGIPRKQVRRLRNVHSEYDIQVELGLLSDILERWHVQKEFLDHNGRPKRLPMHSRGVSFEKLVKACAGDLPAGAVKVELVRLGSAEEDAKGRIHALRRGMIPEGKQDKLITAVAFGLRALASTIASNTAGAEMGAASRFERLCLSDTLAEESINGMRPRLRAKAQTFADQITDMLAEPRPASGGRRVGVGIFYYEDD